jgi:hypothetical protein
MATSKATMPICNITFQGEAAPEASEIKNVMESAGTTVESPRRAPTVPGQLGAGEVILTILLSTAAKATIDVALDHLKSYLVQRLEQQRKKLRLQVVLKRQSKDAAKKVVARELLDLKTATVEAVCKFIGQISDAALKHLAS